MAIERGMPDFHVLRPALEELVFGSGLDRDEMLNQSARLREPELRRIMLLLPREFCFRDAGSVMSYFEQMEQEGRYRLANLPPPEGYPPISPTGETVPFHPHEPSVGSGAGSGDTSSSDYHSQRDE
jgi:hypothetical protein